MLKTSLDAARGLAALWVFLYHIRLGIEPGVFRQFANAGFLGVPAFFVISGYCMMATSRRMLASRQSAGRFLRRRLRRILPPFWASILVVLAVPFLGAAILAGLGGAFHWPAPRWRQFSALDWVELATLTKGLWVTGGAHKPYSAVNPVYWTLSIELQFYLVMTVALAFRRRFDAILLAVTAGCWGTWLAIGPFAPGIFPEYWPMFALGLLLHTVLDRGLRPARLFGRWSGAASAVAFTLLLLGSLGLATCFPSESLARQTVFALLCGLILWTASGIEPAVRAELLVSRALTGLGKISYSLYLLHIQLSSLVAMFVRPVIRGNGVLPALLCVLGTLPLTYAFYRFCERPYTTHAA